MKLTMATGITKNVQFRSFKNIEDLSDLLKSIRMSVKSEDFNGYSEHSKDLRWYTDILDILRISDYTGIQVYRYTILNTDNQIWIINWLWRFKQI